MPQEVRMAVEQSGAEATPAPEAAPEAAAEEEPARTRKPPSPILMR